MKAIITFISDREDGDMRPHFFDKRLDDPMPFRNAARKFYTIHTPFVPMNLMNDATLRLVRLLFERLHLDFIGHSLPDRQPQHRMDFDDVESDLAYRYRDALRVERSIIETDQSHFDIQQTGEID